MKANCYKIQAFSVYTLYSQVNLLLQTGQPRYQSGTKHTCAESCGHMLGGTAEDFFQQPHHSQKATQMFAVNIMDYKQISLPDRSNLLLII